MSQVRIALCANGLPLDNLVLEGIDTSKFSEWVDPKDQTMFARRFTYLLGCAHGIMRTSAGEGNTFSIEVRSGLNTMEVRAVRAALRFTDDYLAAVVPRQGYTLDDVGLMFNVNPLTLN